MRSAVILRDCTYAPVKEDIQAMETPALVSLVLFDIFRVNDKWK